MTAPAPSRRTRADRQRGGIAPARTATLTLAVVLGGLTGLAPAQDYTPAKCTSALPYEGPAKYDKPVEIPLDLEIGVAAFSPDVTLRLDQALQDAMRLTKATHMSASVATAAARWSGSRSADGAAAPLRLYWASVGKALTAVVIMQLAEEGKLSLTDPASRWVPKLPNGKFMTVDHLLLHTSGLFSANEDAKVRSERRYLTPEESIRVSAKHGAMFCPGQAWRYSNTGYTILGQIIEAIEGRPYHEVVNRRIADRLKLPTLRALAPKETPADVAPLAPADGSRPQIAPSWPYAAGAVVGSAEDMLRFWCAVLTGKLLDAENTARLFKDLYPMFDRGTYYGRGVMLYELPGSEGVAKTWLGHSGGSPGVKAVIAYSPADKAFVAVALSGDGSAEASAHLLLRQLAEQTPKAQLGAAAGDDDDRR